MSEQSHPEASRRFPNLYVSQHPLVQHKITRLSEAHTPTTTFRELTEELTHFLVYEATTDLPLKQEIYADPVGADPGECAGLPHRAGADYAGGTGNG